MIPFLVTLINPLCGRASRAQISISKQVGMASLRAGKQFGLITLTRPWIAVVSFAVRQVAVDCEVMPNGRFERNTFNILRFEFYGPFVYQVIALLFVTLQIFSIVQCCQISWQAFLNAVNFLTGEDNSVNNPILELLIIRLWLKMNTK